MVTVLTEHEQCNLGRSGVDHERGDLEYSFCRVALSEKRILIVEDALEDEAFCNNPLVRDGPGIRFYAGVPILFENRVPLGTLCVFGDQPRRLTLQERAGLMQIVCQLEEQLHDALRAMRRTTTSMPAQPKQLALSYLDDIQVALERLGRDPGAADVLEQIDELAETARRATDVLTSRPHAAAVEVIDLAEMLSTVCSQSARRDGLLPIEVTSSARRSISTACNPTLIHQALTDAIAWLSDRADYADYIQTSVLTNETRVFVCLRPSEFHGAAPGPPDLADASASFSSREYSSLGELDVTMKRVCQLVEIQGGNMRVGWEDGGLSLRVELPNLNAVA